jgi:hypothetical protein
LNLKLAGLAAVALVAAAATLAPAPASATLVPRTVFAEETGWAT